MLCQPELQETTRNEINLLRSLDHPDIVKTYEVCHDTNKNLSIVVEHCARGDLNSRLPYVEQQAADILRQILEAVHNLRSISDIVRRDLKCNRSGFTAPSAVSRFSRYLNSNLMSFFLVQLCLIVKSRERIVRIR
jgi:serine/threonine protein kinase